MNFLNNNNHNFQNLADVGYDDRNMFLAGYDWRVSYYHLEKRDGYFTRLKYIIEMMKKSNNQKVVILAHSMGSIVFQYFLKWIESKNGANSGSDLVSTYIESIVHIGGAMLGVPKAVSSLFSGEMRDTAELNPVIQFIKDNWLSKGDLMKVFRSWRSIASLIPKGGDAVWGTHSMTPNSDSFHGMVIFNKNKSLENPPFLESNVNAVTQKWQELISLFSLDVNLNTIYFFC